MASPLRTGPTIAPARIYMLYRLHAMSRQTREEDFLLPVRIPFKAPWWGHSGEFNMSSCNWTTPGFRLKTRKGHTVLMRGTDFWLFRGGKNVKIYQKVLSSAQLPQSKTLLLHSKRFLLTRRQQHQSATQLWMLQCSGKVTQISWATITAQRPSEYTCTRGDRLIDRGWREPIQLRLGFSSLSHYCRSKLVLNKPANGEEKMSAPIPHGVSFLESHPQPFAGFLCRHPHLWFLTFCQSQGACGQWLPLERFVWTISTSKRRNWTIFLHCPLTALRKQS